MNSLTALGAAALLVRIGFALYVAGLVRAKNSAGTVLRILCDIFSASLAFWAIGVAILFQTHNAIFGIDSRLLLGSTDLLRGDAVFFHFAMILTASGIVFGAVAERFRFLPCCGASLLLAGVVFPVAGNWVWSGWLGRRGYVDLGGASVLHVSAAVCAAVGAIVVGPRGGKYNRDGSSTMIPGHNVNFASFGAMLMLVGFVPYIAGSWMMRLRPVDLDTSKLGDALGELAGRGALNVLLSASAAGLGGMILSHFRYRKIDIGVVLMGFLGGVVASAAASNAMSTFASVLSGIVAGFLVPWAAIALDLRLRIDDPAGVIAVHGVGGAWGTIAVALFSSRSPLQSQMDGSSALGFRLRFLIWQIVGVIAIAAMSAILSMVLFVTLKRTVGIRAREADEFDGLDLAEHDIGAYPDFQQTTIKSYHLREA